MYKLGFFLGILASLNNSGKLTCLICVTTWIEKYFYFVK
ncbi:hypothetical protein ENHAE0001_2040 [Enhydrobacter aerosaccus SK60]|nr:hypothetical protein ENHAE0001_2040 [Enhydrobacter aerosaccus SK60]